MRNHTRGRKPFFLLFIAFFFLIGWLVMFLWNAILPDLLGIKQIGYWQSIGLLALCRILFGHFGFKGRPGPGGRFGGGERFKERMMNMTDEERERLQRLWRNKCS
ncbi:hypothetical protein DBR32_12260 [Taibaiella sp. KBW10]|uniref:hypothetical protein n=1 Tax=Taibaiella sp. KBW10 TaxID=2153357 RepID=UPI000F5AEC79|nr:hypothetical protein [Taibaiella sp. KBW10]RQO30337.1 hypothetical protein DBR32_12260 [Taibaiella sp. KBW10]